MEKLKWSEASVIALKWAGTIVIMIVFMVIAILVGKLLKNSEWIVFILDTAFCILFWVMLKSVKKNAKSPSPSNIIQFGFLAITMIIIIIVLAGATIALLDVLLIRINILVFILMLIATVGIFIVRYKKSK